MERLAAYSFSHDAERQDLQDLMLKQGQGPVSAKKNLPPFANAYKNNYRLIDTIDQHLSSCQLPFIVLDVKSMWAYNFFSLVCYQVVAVWREMLTIHYGSRNALDQAGLLVCTQEYTMQLFAEVLEAVYELGDSGLDMLYPQIFLSQKNNESDSLSD